MMGHWGARCIPAAVWLVEPLVLAREVGYIGDIEVAPKAVRAKGF